MALDWSERQTIFSALAFIPMSLLAVVDSDLVNHGRPPSMFDVTRSVIKMVFEVLLPLCLYFHSAKLWNFKS